MSDKYDKCINATGFLVEEKQNNETIKIIIQENSEKKKLNLYNKRAHYWKKKWYSTFNPKIYPSKILWTLKIGERELFELPSKRPSDL